MDPFNIIIRVDGAQVDINIHPQEAGTYKLVYHGALIGEIFMGSDGENWEAITADELQPGGFPVYEYDETSGHQNILLDEATVQEIGRQINSLEER
ncbi:hypothetical protein [Pedobacter heparinus]|uniref:Uncharacterized protein n=1 Tax=Pedobacter heparinus (strain ATCC 13125 / DSM 2366 / CIP 104194 / JCM 7457 / NBRC 12017 / NCIMB 9290 / NRRL B-14731 / HIM 762-3) TaxID=485917 RepID=C6Y0C3_PEDHD|nr:hypothetical protein [Pedobacter heparinus]ACU04835.1 hypothetical protein Phep_2632 [Pedobacter heparinus DSM 2366]